VGTPSVGEVVLVPYPFSDLSQAKIRPALCLADAGVGDYILCQITSNPFGDPKALPLKNADFAVVSLKIDRVIRPGKLFTAHYSLMVGSAGKLKPVALKRVLQTVVAMFGA
jgi:hypothetical protein